MRESELEAVRPIQERGARCSRSASVYGDDLIQIFVEAVTDVLTATITGHPLPTARTPGFVAQSKAVNLKLLISDAEDALGRAVLFILGVAEKDSEPYRTQAPTDRDEANQQTASNENNTPLPAAGLDS